MALFMVQGGYVSIPLFFDPSGFCMKVPSQEGMKGWVIQDIERQKRIEGLGVRFLRFTDEEIKQNIEGVVAVIEEWIRENAHTACSIQPTPAPLPRGDL